MTAVPWIWWLSGGTVAVAALCLAVWSLFGDCARGRLRCPRCWYDMRGSADLRCPECGHEAIRVKRLGRTRRHWRTAAASAILVILGASGIAKPTVDRAGWMALIPTFALLRLAPPPEAEFRLVAGKEVHNRICAELSRRSVAEVMTARDWDYLLHHGGIVTVPRRWPEGERLQYRFWQPRWLHAQVLLSPRLPGGIADRNLAYEGILSLDPPQRDTTSVVFDVIVQCSRVTGKGRERKRTEWTAWQGTAAFPIEVVTNPPVPLTPVTDSTLDAAVRHSFNLRFSNERTGCPAPLRPGLGVVRGAFLHSSFRDQYAGPFHRTNVLLEIEILRDGIIQDAASLSTNLSCTGTLNRGGTRTLDSLNGDWDEGGREQLLRWTVRVRGRKPDSPQLDCDSYWAGELTIPLIDLTDWDTSPSTPVARRR
jgi:hypothetical protein